MLAFRTVQQSNHCAREELLYELKAGPAGGRTAGANRVTTSRICRRSDKRSGPGRLGRPVASGVIRGVERSQLVDPAAFGGPQLDGPQWDAGDAGGVGAATLAVGVSGTGLGASSWAMAAW
jgi:hypothetical protein